MHIDEVEQYIETMRIFKVLFGLFTWVQSIGPREYAETKSEIMFWGDLVAFLCMEYIEIDKPKVVCT